MCALLTELNTYLEASKQKSLNVCFCWHPNAFALIRLKELKGKILGRFCS